MQHAYRLKPKRGNSLRHIPKVAEYSHVAWSDAFPTVAQLCAGISSDRILGIGIPRLAQHMEQRCLFWCSPAVVQALRQCPKVAWHLEPTLRVPVQSLSFARVASVVRACAFKIEPGTRPEDLRFPFVGPARAAQICDIATMGTTLELEQHR